MPQENRIFAAKLDELARRYAQIHARLFAYQTADHAAIQAEKQQLAAACLADAARLQEASELSRSPAVAALAKAQQEYLEKGRQIMAAYLDAAPEAQTEAASLLAEYAIDFATQAVNHALLTATDLHLKAAAATATAGEI